MQFNQITGQQLIKNQLVNIVQQNRLSHALLFLGKEGSGALSLAIAFAQYMVCSTVQAIQPAQPSLFGNGDSQPSSATTGVLVSDSCGVCAACKKATQLIHPDIHFSFPVVSKKSGEAPVSADYIGEWREFVTSNPYGNVFDWLQFIAAENKQGNITAKECEHINHIINLKSFESGYKILLMWMPEFLGKEGNKLLKLIEEPPPDTLFILVAEDESAILPTILSRMQLIKIPWLTNHEVEKDLISKKEVSETQARQIASVCEGNYREALQMLQHADEDWQSKVREWLNAILKTGPAAQVKWVDEISKLGREKQKQFLKYFVHLLQQAIRIRLQKDTVPPGCLATNHAAEKDYDFAGRLNKFSSVEAQEAIINELDKASYYIERNANAKMLFHALTIRLYHIIKYNSLILVN